MNSNSKKKARKSKKETTGRNFVCDVCKKSYLSYPALYTHKRNKHNIIPITGKPDFFKNSNSDSNAKFKYNTHVSKKELQEGLIMIIDTYLQFMQENLLNTNSCLYKPHSDGNDVFVNELRKFLMVDLQNISIPNSAYTLNIDTILIIYVVLLIKVKADPSFIKKVTKFLFLFREYLNLMGWDFMMVLQDYGLVNYIDKTQLFCAVNNCEEIPELLNDFVTVFLEMEEDFSSEKNEISDLAENFCYWLYINDLTPYKIFKLDD